MSCFICSNCSDCINDKIVDKSCTLISDHDPSFCVEDLQLEADWKIVTKKVSE